MAGETNQNDQVQDLLARLRLQMSQLDEEFGLPKTDAENEVTPDAVPDDREKEETAQEPLTEDTPPVEEDIFAQEETAPEEALPQEVLPEIEAMPQAEPHIEAPAASMGKPTQIDLFGALDALFSAETAETPVVAEDAVPSSAPETDAEDEADDVPVFSKDAVSIRIQKERIVADEALLDDTAAEKVGTVVTEVELPTPDPAREQTETHASFFVPDAVAVEDTQQPSASPFAPERRFDPTRYDEMLAAYEKRKQMTVEEEDDGAPEAPPPTPVLPQTPILMPRTPIVLPIFPDEEEATLEDAASTETIIEAPAPSEAEPLPTENALAEISEEEATEEAVAEAPNEDAPEETAPAAESPTAEAPVSETPTQEASDAVPVSEELLVEETPQTPPSRVFLAKADLSDNDRAPRTHASSGRVHLAPTAYRAKDTKTGGKEKTDDEEDYMEGLPLGIRESLVGSPLGRPNRAQGAKHTDEQTDKNKKKRRGYRFLEEITDARSEEASHDYIHHHIEEELRQTRIRLIVISILAFVLLLLENITHVTALVPRGFVDVKTAGVVDMLLLLGAMIAAWPRLLAGAKGIRYGRVLPESILLIEVLVALGYAAAFGFLGAPVKYFSFVPAFGLSVLYSFRVLSCEEKLKTLGRLNTREEKLLLSPVAKKDMQAEMRALGAKGEAPLIYRVRKTASVKGFLRRSTTVCEDEGVNLAVLLAMPGVGALCFLLSFFVGGYTLNESLQSVLFGCFLAAPLFMCGVHVYCMHRTVAAAGEDSVIVGEASVKEAITSKAISFEDVEAAPAAGVVLSGIRVHCDDPSSVFKYLTALYGYIGGPLCGRFSGIYTDRSVAATALVELVDATEDGVSAVVEGAEVVVGNARYMTASHITSVPGISDDRALTDARNGVLYVAVNRMVCMTFYMEHKISSAFEKNVLHLHRLGIAAILRTYDPNFNEDTVSRSPVLRECRVHVVSKRVEERNDFYAERAEGGIATSGSTGKLLKLFLLCFRANKLLRFGKGFKLVGVLLGTATAAVLSVLGFFHIIPSVYIALYHLLLLAFYMLCVRVGVRLGGASEEK